MSTLTRKALVTNIPGSERMAVEEGGWSMTLERFMTEELLAYSQQDYRITLSADRCIATSPFYTYDSYVGPKYGDSNNNPESGKKTIFPWSQSGELTATYGESNRARANVPRDGGGNVRPAGDFIQTGITEYNGVPGIYTIVRLNGVTKVYRA